MQTNSYWKKTSDQVENKISMNKSSWQIILNTYFYGNEIYVLKSVSTQTVQL